MPKTQKKKPLFTLISVTLNNLTGLQKTYKSISGQTLNDYEWLVIDGASTDGTQKWLDSRAVPYMSEPDNSLYDAMNKGVMRAKGQYLLFLNAGDMLAAPETLDQLSRAANAAQSPDFIYGDCYEETAAGQSFYKTAKSHTQIARGMITHHQAMLYRRAAIGGARYDLRYTLAADYDFTARFLQKTKTALHCNFPLCVFEAGGLSQINAAQSRDEEAQIRRVLYLGSPLMNAITTMRQTLAQSLKINAPALYKFIRKFS